MMMMIMIMINSDSLTSGRVVILIISDSLWILYEHDDENNDSYGDENGES